ncbi:MAG: YdeI/OmpD-associated family protein [Ignavibacterium sp.]|jgi:uncharacterized protein YdeI (YjbR/CyaY-like superfamily)
MEIGNTLYVSTRAQWRAWLRRHHLTASEIWLVYYKKNSSKARLPYNEAVEEALCFGWIDNILKRIDEEKYAQRFTPRKPGSPWSAANRERYRRLVRLGRMTRAGREAYRHSHSNPKRTTELPRDIVSAIRADPVAWKYFCRFPSSYRRVRIGWIDGARKRPSVFRQRLAYFLRMTRQGRQYGMIR